MQLSFRILTISGIPVRIHLTLLILLPWMSGRMSDGWNLTASGGWLMVTALFASVALHEFGHALAARRYGVRTREIVLSPLGGVARLDRIPARPMHEFVIAVAGPLVSVALALLLFTTAAIVPDVRFAPLLQIIGYLNAALFIFNLIPCFPMDGGRILRAALSARRGRLESTRIAVKLGGWIALGLAVFGLYHFNLILVLLAWMVHQAARNEYRAVQLEHEGPKENPFARIFWQMQGGMPTGRPPAPTPRQEQQIEVEVSPPPYRRNDPL